MKNDEYLIYINWDGFGRYYYDIANSDTYKGTTNLNSLIKEGVFFEKLYTGIPSITYPMQSAIVSGSYSEHTENVYKYYSKEEKKLILCRRKNSAETIGQVLYRENIPFVSVQQFALLEKGAQWDEKNRLYIQPGGDYKNRFKELFKLLEGKEIISKDKAFSYEELPRVIFLYVDDLDSIGHNQLYKRGKLRAFTEKGRVRNVVNRLLQMDKMLGELIDKLKALNIYDKTTILLTTDHGMVPYKGKSCFDALSQALKALSYASVKALDKEGQQGELEENEVIAVSAGVQLQLYFKDSCKNKLEEIKKALQQEEYVETVLTKYDLSERGTAEFFADILVSPKPPYHFHLGEKNSFLLGGAHDSLNEKAQHIFGVLKGNYFKQNYKCMEKVNNIDFIPTICTALSLPLPANSRGKILKSILK
ncbi:alkaline phosphatase family protein [Clostridium swellfunianum]|uniref:alkaline phosphatase family protein n=1 Tax=Clostridium swellfunianum TaxID=1367462 RepID=UPI00202ED6CE|nr:alkaline phosphatase family protein [Clostridium swellfunianum]MCM0651042.1 alkaline phosphatase family protein [Clostridium swellfunianum]